MACRTAVRLGEKKPRGSSEPKRRCFDAPQAEANGHGANQWRLIGSTLESSTVRCIARSNAMFEFNALPFGDLLSTFQVGGSFKVVQQPANVVANDLSKWAFAFFR